MFWGRKGDKKSLPDLPPYKRPAFLAQRAESVVDGEQNLEEEHFQKQELPSFPDSMNDRGFSQAAIKDAVSQGAVEEIVFPNKGKEFQAVEMEEWAPSIEHRNVPERAQMQMGSMSTGMKLGEPSASFDNRFEMQKSIKNADIFVKLDKFYSARKALIEAQQKIRDIDELLKKIRETKMREEQELSAWEKELMTIKSRMNDITVNLFEKVD